MTKRPSPTLYDLARGMLRPAYDRLANAHHIKRDPVTDEITFKPVSLEQRIREAGLV